MRILAIRDIVAPIKSDIANAYIDFSTMTVSVLAIVTDLLVEGRPVVGFGFNSNGRYAPQGLLRERFDAAASLYFRQSISMGVRLRRRRSKEPRTLAWQIVSLVQRR